MGSIPTASTILPNKTRLSEVALRRDVCPITPYYQRGWVFLTSFPPYLSQVEFDLLRSFSFSVRPVFSVPSGLRPNLVQTG